MTNLSKIKSFQKDQLQAPILKSRRERVKQNLNFLIQPKSHQPISKIIFQGHRKDLNIALHTCIEKITME